MIDNDMILKIEKALGFKLYPLVIDYLNNKECDFIGRKSGLTTAYILKLLLKKNETIKLRDIGKRYIDSIHGTHYPSWFKHEFMKTRDLLMSNGIEVIKIEYV